MIRITAPAKVNLFLRVLAREDSGFHQLETLFQALELGDALALQVAEAGISLSLDGPPMGPLEGNLAYRAADAFREAAGILEGVGIQLVKRVPVQGGLGGGSSDAAAVLKAMDSLFPGRLGPDDLLSLAATLGSDVPFFMAPSPLSLAWGRGERLLALPPLPRRAVLVVAPPLGVNTGEAYAMLARSRKERRASGPPVVYRPEELSDWREVARLADNEFEEVVLSAHPTLAILKEAMESTGPEIALLSGSGSSLFAVFKREAAARHSRQRLRARFPDCRFLLTRTLDRFPDPISAPGVEG